VGQENGLIDLLRTDFKRLNNKNLLEEIRSGIDFVIDGMEDRDSWDELDTKAHTLMYWELIHQIAEGYKPQRTSIHAEVAKYHKEFDQIFDQEIIGRVYRDMDNISVAGKMLAVYKTIKAKLKEFFPEEQPLVPAYSK